MRPPHKIKRSNAVKKKTMLKRRVRNQEKGISKGNSKYAIKEALQRKGIYSPASPFYRGNNG